MSELSTAGGGKVHVIDNELIEVYQKLEAISTELEINLTRCINQIKENAFYTDGEAKYTVSKLGEANTKFLELFDHYSRLATVVQYNLQKMQSTDEDIKNRVIGNLEV